MSVVRHTYIESFCSKYVIEYIYGFQQHYKTRERKEIFMILNWPVTIPYTLVLVECITTNYFMDMWKWKAILNPKRSKREDHKKWNTLLRRVRLKWSYGWSRSISNILFHNFRKMMPKKWWLWINSIIYPY